MDEAAIIALLQFGHQMCIKSTHKALMGYEALCYEKICGWTALFTERLGEQLERGQDERSDKTKGRSS